MNISFASMANEECEDCIEFFEHTNISGHSKHNLPNFDGCEYCDKWFAHIQRAGWSRNQYKIDKDMQSSKKLFVSSDMQKVVMLPRAPGLKRVLFAHRLTVYNQTFAALGS
jgi:hypothetical protein